MAREHTCAGRVSGHRLVEPVMRVHTEFKSIENPETIYTFLYILNKKIYILTKY
jgi:hypothetical protein